MPAIWKISETAPAKSGAVSGFADTAGQPIADVELRPSRSLSRQGFAWLLVITWGLLVLVALPFLGTPAEWVLVPILLAVLGALWLGFNRNYRDGDLCERLTLWPDVMRVHRHNPRSPAQNWQAKTHWVRLNLIEFGGPVENYVTLKGGGREIEIGAFLSADERAELHERLGQALARARGAFA